MVVASFAIVTSLIFYWRNYKRKLIKKGGSRVITKDSIREIMPDCDKRMTHEEFLKWRRLRNDEKPFSELLSELPDADGSYEALKVLFANT